MAGRFILGFYEIFMRMTGVAKRCCAACMQYVVGRAKANRTQGERQKRTDWNTEQPLAAGFGPELRWSFHVVFLHSGLVRIQRRDVQVDFVISDL